MPVYNAAHLLEGALDALLGQTMIDFELIISDNASTDDTAEICAARAAADARVRIIRQPRNIGPQPNFGVVLGEANTRYFMWAAHDDRWERMFLERLVGELQEDPKAGLACSDFDVLLHASGEQVTHLPESMPDLRPDLGRAQMVERLLRSPQPLFVYGVHRTEVLRRTRALHKAQFDFSDLALVTEIALQARVRYVPDVLFHAGVAGEKREAYSLGRRHLPGLKLNYGRYAWLSAAAVARAPGLSLRERVRLEGELVRQVARLAHWHEWRSRRRRDDGQAAA